MRPALLGAAALRLQWYAQKVGAGPPPSLQVAQLDTAWAGRGRVEELAAELAPVSGGDGCVWESGRRRSQNLCRFVCVGGGAERSWRDLL